jgi:8-oxo-dGTP pyrophosphatase MutT (NUDIX family)
VEPGESDLEAALAETEEELGGFPSLQVIGEKSMSSGDFTYTTFFARMPGELAKAWTPQLNWENDEWKWFSKNKLPIRLHPGVRKVI